MALGAGGAAGLIRCLELLEKEITRAFVYSYQEQAEALFQNYLDHAEAYVNKTRVRDRNTKEELPPAEGFLKSIGGDVEAARKQPVALHPIGPLGEPDDVAYAVLYLASEESKFATGSELVIDGGFTAR